VRLNELHHDDSEEGLKLKARLQGLSEMERKGEYGRYTDEDIKGAFERAIPRGLISAEHEEALSKFAERMIAVVGECTVTGRVTDAAAELIEKHSTEGMEALYRDLFGEDFRG
jgi:hypothetical protein